MYESETYKKAFDMIGSKAVITEATLEKRRRFQKKRHIQQAVYAFVACAVLFIGSNAVSYAMNGEIWLSYAFSAKAGNGGEITLEEYTGEEINDVAMISVKYPDSEAVDYFIQEAGRLFFVFGDIKEDITDLCTGDAYFSHEYYDESNIRHVIVIGCTDGAPECAEYIFVDNNYVFCLAPFIENDAPEDTLHYYLVKGPISKDIRYEKGKPAWLANAEKELGL